MGFSINSSQFTGSAQLSLLLNSQSLAQSIQRLSTGLRINSAADDPSGLAESQALTSQINGLTQAVANAQSGLSLAQTASGALTQTQTILQDMRTLAVQATSVTLSASDQSAIQASMNQLAGQLNQITGSTTFNGKNLLSGAFQNQQMQVGANAGDTLGISIGAVDAATLGVAGSTGTLSATVNSAGVQSLSNVGSTLLGTNVGEKYQITTTTETGAAITGSYYSATTGTSNVASSGQNLGSETMASGGTNSTGGSLTYRVQVAAVNANGVVTSVKYAANTTATTGALTWTTAAIGAGSAFTLSNGLTATFTAGAATSQVGDQFTFTAAAAGAAGAITAGTNINNATGALSGTYTGTTNTQYIVKAAALDTNNNVVGVNVSTDGGKTFTTAPIYTTTAAYNPGLGGNIGVAGTAAAFTLSNGVTLTWTPGANNADQTATSGDTLSFNAIAAGNSAQVMQMTDITLSGGAAKFAGSLANVGQSVVLNTGQTSATVGTGTQVITANFNAAGGVNGVTAGTTQFTVSTPQAATVANGVVLNAATAPTGINIMSQTAASAAITAITNAIAVVSQQQTQLGAVQNRLTNTINANLSTGQNLETANSTLTEANFAQETIKFNTAKIIQQSAISVLYQASQLPSLYLKLLN